MFSFLLSVVLRPYYGKLIKTRCYHQKPFRIFGQILCNGRISILFAMRRVGATPPWLFLRKVVYLLVGSQYVSIFPNQFFLVGYGQYFPS